MNEFEAEPEFGIKCHFRGLCLSLILFCTNAASVTLGDQQYPFRLMPYSVHLQVAESDDGSV